MFMSNWDAHLIQYGDARVVVTRALQFHTSHWGFGSYEALSIELYILYIIILLLYIIIRSQDLHLGMQDSEWFVLEVEGAGVRFAIKKEYEHAVARGAKI